MLSTLFQAGRETLVIAGRTLPVIGISLILVELSVAYGLLQRVQVLCQPLVRLARLPAASGPALVTAFGPSLSAAALGALYKGGEVSAQATTTAALTGSLLALPVFALCYSLARSMAVFGPALGCLNVLVSLMIGIIARLCMLIFVPIPFHGQP